MGDKPRDLLSHAIRETVGLSGHSILTLLRQRASFTSTGGSKRREDHQL